MADISVIGAGSWGTALAALLYKNGHRVTVWSILQEEIDMLEKEHEHKDKLPGVKLPEDMVFTADLKGAVKGKDILVLAVPSPFTRSTANRMKEYVAEGQIIVNVAKGIEEKSLLTLSQIVEEEIPGLPMRKKLEEGFRRRSWWVQRIKKRQSICRIYL